ncbi:MAG: TlpA family protein disulfide reductase [Gammaproteobacteria bacterium]|nr:MAG: TlpA family protein disulfide reductase [Gammaproteobacteria bacterium]
MKLLRYILPLWFTLSVQAAGLPPGIMVMDGRPAPALRLDNIDGESWDISSRRGHWLFVHFWASWCGPCRREMPTIQKLMDALPDERLEIVLVNTAETEDQVFSFLGIVAPDAVPLMDTDGLVTESWQPRGLPATFLVDPEGRIRYLVLGGREWNTPPYLEFLRRIIKP